MFGIIEIDGTVHKAKTCEKTICNAKALCVKIPKSNPRNLRRAAKKLRGIRVVIPDEANKLDYEKIGICVISNESLLCRMVFELYMSVLSEFKLQAMNITLLICATHFNDEELKLLVKFSQNARYISLRASNAENAAQYLLENYGVAVIHNTASADIIINMYENNFSLHIIINGREYILNDVKVLLPDAHIYPLHIKGVCMALLQEGKIIPPDIIISSIAYDKKFLDI